MLIVISYPTPVENEASLINQLFDEGLQVFHLRKPDMNEDAVVELMEKINAEHYSKIAFHQHHALAKSFGINRLHLTERNRMNLKESDIETLKSNNILSTSVHSIDEYNGLSQHYNYSFLGPVFDSISKKDYKAIDIELKMHSDKKRNTKLIAIGGITHTNLHKALSLGFDGVAALGSIWENENPINEFIKIKKVCKHSEIMH